jgi:nucleoside 2-deoxyribosyltransferase
VTAKILPLRQRPHIYLAGPMRGRWRYNFDAFDAACEDLRALDYTVTSPHEHDLEQGFDPDRTLDDQGFDLKAAMAWDLGQVLVCDAVVVLPGWATSAGTTAEVATARAVGTPVLELVEILEHGAAVAA